MSVRTACSAITEAGIVVVVVVVVVVLVVVVVVGATVVVVVGVVVVGATVVVVVVVATAETVVVVVVVATAETVVVSTDSPLSPPMRSVAKPTMSTTVPIAIGMYSKTSFRCERMNPMIATCREYATDLANGVSSLRG